MAEDGTMTFAKDFENGKRVRFQKDAENPTAAGPDAEGISVDGNGMVHHFKSTAFYLLVL